MIQDRKFVIDSNKKSLFDKLVQLKKKIITFPACFKIPIIFSNLNSNCSNLLYIWETSRNKLKKNYVTKNCSELSLFKQIVLVISKTFANSQPSASNFKSFSWSLEQCFLTVGQKNYGNKIPALHLWNILAHFFQKNWYYS